MRWGSASEGRRMKKTLFGILALAAIATSGF